MANTKENKNPLIVFNFNNHVKPVIKEDVSNNWVMNGKNNSYFCYVNDRYIGSPTNSAINNGYCRLIYGKGLAARDQVVKLEQYAKLKTILKGSDVRRIVKDFQVQGMAYIQVVYNRDRSLNSMTHIAVDKIVPEVANEKDEILNYYFSKDWENKTKEGNEPIKIPAFGTSKEGRAVYAIRPYQMGMEYFALPSYQSGLESAELEEEISHFLLSHMKNGMSAGYIVNIPDSYTLEDEVKDEIERKIKSQLTGSDKAGTMIVNFANGEKTITVEVLEISDAHDKWQFSSTEAQNKIMISHEVVSPLLFGVKDATGFSSNADELDAAESQTLKRVVQPKQNELTDAFEDILRTDGITLDLYFKPLTEEKETIVEEQTTELSSHLCCSKDEDGASSKMADELISFGEDNNDEEWLLLSVSDVDYDTDDDIYSIINLATSTGVARPNANSEQDSEDIKIRYRYAGNKSPQRDFCRKMMQADKLYRKEDILQMERPGINDGFGLNGTDSYSIWLWKGGGKMSEKFPNGTCKHKWQREIYLKVNGNVDVNSPLAKTITTTEARRRGYRVPVNESDVSVTPHNNK